MTDRGMYDQPGVPDVQAGTEIGPDGPPDFPCCASSGPKFGISLYPTEPTYTASEVKVLTETASKVAYALGRKDAGEEIAVQIAAELDEFGSRAGDYATGMNRARRIAVDIARFASGATSDATSGVPGHQEVSEAVRSPQEPCGHPTCPCAERNTP